MRNAISPARMSTFIIDSSGARRATVGRLIVIVALTCIGFGKATEVRAEPAGQAGLSYGQESEADSETDRITRLLQAGPETWTSPEGLRSSLQVMLLLTVLSLAPAVLLMTTSFVRIVIVLGLLRQALGTQQLPPNQVMTSIAMFLTVLLMTPVWQQVYNDALVPYTDPDSQMSLQEAWHAGVQPVRRFMSQQIEAAGNGDDVRLFYEYTSSGAPDPQTYDDIPLQALLPAFMLSELKTAFLIGFQIYLPFLILDIVVASVTVSMGMLMVPPAMISLPLKLMLFVLVDGWHLVVGMLLESFAPFG
jgi:flagellar biosynthetic protein FliP